jgi:DNA-binding beta-propeller fold protein YncE
VGALVLFLSASISAPAGNAEARSEFYAVTKKPASFTVIDRSKREVLATVPLDGTPFDAVLGAGNTRAYVLQGPEEKGGLSEISVVDLATRTVAARIPVEQSVRRLYWSIDKRFLICASASSVVLFDPMKNEVVATKTPGRLSFKTLFTPDASRFFFISGAERANKEKGTPAHQPSITTFSLEQKDPLADVELPDVSAAVLSPDGKWLYVLDPGNPDKKPERHRDAAVAVIEVETGKIAATHSIGIQPRELSSDLDNGVVTVFARQTAKETATNLYIFRGKDAPTKLEAGEEASGLRSLGSDGVRVILARDSLRFLDKDSNLLRSTVPLSLPSGDKPGEALPLSDCDRLVISVVDRIGEPTGKLAIVDLKQRTVSKEVTTGRGKIRFLKNALAAADAGMALASSARMVSDPTYRAAYIRNPSLYNYGNLYSPPAPNPHVAAGPQGKFVYAFNAQTGDITVLASDDGAILKTIPFGNCDYILPLPGGKFMVARNRGSILLINTATHDFVEYKVPGFFRSLYVFRDSPLMAALTGKGLLFWETEKGAPLGDLTTLEPVLLLEAPPAAPAQVPAPAPAPHPQRSAETKGEEP